MKLMITPLMRAVIAAACRRNGLPTVALNVEKDDVFNLTWPVVVEQMEEWPNESFFPMQRWQVVEACKKAN